MAGLDAVDAGIAPQQRVAIVLLDAVPLEILDRGDRVVLGEVVDQRARQQRDVVRGRVVIRDRVAGGVLEVGVDHAELLGVGIHQPGERLLGTGGVFGQRDRGIVAGLDDHAVQQILQRYLAVELEEAGGAVGAGAAAAPGVLADGDRIGHVDLAVGDLGRDDVVGHDLGDRRRFHAQVRFLAGENLAGRVIHQHPALAVDIRRWRHRRVRHHRARHRRRDAVASAPRQRQTSKVAAANGKQGAAKKIHRGVQSGLLDVDAHGVTWMDEANAAQTCSVYRHLWARQAHAFDPGADVIGPVHVLASGPTRTRRTCVDR